MPVNKIVIDKRVQGKNKELNPATVIAFASDVEKQCNTRKTNKFVYVQDMGKRKRVPLDSLCREIKKKAATPVADLKGLFGDLQRYSRLCSQSQVHLDNFNKFKQ